MHSKHDAENHSVSPQLQQQQQLIERSGMFEEFYFESSVRYGHFDQLSSISAVDGRNCPNGADIRGGPLRTILLNEYSAYLQRQPEVQSIQNELRKLTGFDPRNTTAGMVE